LVRGASLRRISLNPQGLTVLLRSAILFYIVPPACGIWL
jgi:hypothetical protein